MRKKSLTKQMVATLQTVANWERELGRCYDGDVDCRSLSGLNKRGLVRLVTRRGATHQGAPRYGYGYSVLTDAGRDALARLEGS